MRETVNKQRADSMSGRQYLLNSGVISVGDNTDICGHLVSLETVIVEPELCAYHSYNCILKIA